MAIPQSKRMFIKNFSIYTRFIFNILCDNFPSMSSLFARNIEKFFNFCGGRVPKSGAALQLRRDRGGFENGFSVRDGGGTGMPCRAYRTRESAEAVQARARALRPLESVPPGNRRRREAAPEAVSGRARPACPPATRICQAAECSSCRGNSRSGTPKKLYLR